MNYYFLLLLIGAYLAQEPQLPNRVIQLYGNISLGQYYANIFVGFPPQQQSVIVDTGSGQLALPCSKCQNCSKSHLQPPFQLSQSKTSKIVTCGSGQQICKRGCNVNKQDSQPCIFSISYAEGSSLSGIIIQDQIQFEKESKDESIKTTFGCTTKETKLFYTQAANGIFGLAPERQSKLLQKLHNKHSLKTGEQLLFSLCLAKNGGQFVIGKLRPQIHRNKESVKTGFVTMKNLYTLSGIGQIRMKDKIIKEVEENSGFFGVFIDSGSTFSYLPRQNFLKLSRALQKACVDQPQKCQRSKLNSNCFKINPQENSTIHQTVLQIFPSIELQINNYFLGWRSADYFYLRNPKNKEVCIGIQSSDRFLLGSNWMVNRDIAFNLQQKTVQIFPNAFCSKIGSNQEQNAQLQLAVFTEEQGEYSSLLSLILGKGNSLFDVIIIFLCFLGFILVMLVSVGKFFGNNKIIKPQSTQQEYDIMTSTSLTQRELPKNQSSDEINSERYANSSQQEIFEQIESKI